MWTWFKFASLNKSGILISLVVLLFQTEIILTEASQGGKTIANTSTFLPKMPPNPTRIDHLIIGQMKEQAKVPHCHLQTNFFTTILMRTLSDFYSSVWNNV